MGKSDRKDISFWMRENVVVQTLKVSWKLTFSTEYSAQRGRTPVSQGLALEVEGRGTRRRKAWVLGRIKRVLTCFVIKTVMEMETFFMALSFLGVD